MNEALEKTETSHRRGREGAYMRSIATLAGEAHHARAEKRRLARALAIETAERMTEKGKAVPDFLKILAQTRPISKGLISGL